VFGEHFVVIAVKLAATDSHEFFFPIEGINHMVVHVGLMVGYCRKEECSIESLLDNLDLASIIGCWHESHVK